MSVVLNIAEGSGKSSDRELNRYFDIALGSLYEVVASFDLLRLNKMLSEDEFVIITRSAEEIARELGGFKKKLKAH